MPLEKIKIEIYQGLDALFTTAIVDEMAGDMDAYSEKVEKIANIAEVLGIETEIIAVSLTLKKDESLE